MDNLPAPMHASPPLTAHDARTADALFSSYGGRLFAYFHLMLASETGAKRALTDTLMAATAEVGRAGRLRDLDEYAPRLFALARAECRKYQSAEAVGAGRHWTTGDGSSGNPVLAEVARRAVARLAPDVREAYILSAPHNNLSLPQLAEVLGLGLDAAADLRAQAGLDFVRAVALCAQEASFIDFSGADLRIRAEESLARDATEPPPALPLLSDPALAAFRETPGTPPMPRQSRALARQAPPPLPSALAAAPLPPPPLSADPVPTDPAPTAVEPFLPAGPGHPTRADLAAPAGFGGGPGYGRQPGHDHDPGHDSDPGYDGPAESYGGWGRLTGPLRALTGPMQLGGSSARGGRRWRAVLVWAGGGIAAVAAVIIVGQMLVSGSDSTVTLTHGGVPADTTSVNPGFGMPMPTPRKRRPGPGRSPASHQSANGSVPGAGVQPAAGTTPGQVAPQPTYANPRPSASATRAPKPAPDPAPTRSTTSPSASPSSSAATPSATSPSASST